MTPHCIIMHNFTVSPGSVLMKHRPMIYVCTSCHIFTCFKKRFMIVTNMCWCVCVSVLTEISQWSLASVTCPGSVSLQECGNSDPLSCFSVTDTHDSLCPSLQGSGDWVVYLTAKNGQTENIWGRTRGGMGKQGMFKAIFLCRQMREIIYNTAKNKVRIVSFSWIALN